MLAWVVMGKRQRRRTASPADDPYKAFTVPPSEVGSASLAPASPGGDGLRRYLEGLGPAPLPSLDVPSLWFLATAGHRSHPDGVQALALLRWWVDCAEVDLTRFYMVERGYTWSDVAASYERTAPAVQERLRRLALHVGEDLDRYPWRVRRRPGAGGSTTDGDGGASLEA